MRDARASSVSICSCLVLVLLAASTAGAQLGFTAINATGGLADACALAQAPDGRVFICERLTGAVRVFDARTGVLASEPWAVVPDVTGSADAETGLLGIAVHPNFLATGWVYVYATRTPTGEGTRNSVLRLTDDRGAGVDPVVILDDIPSSPLRNGGALAFGRDARLYVLGGDAANAAPAQDPADLRGKVLRVEDDGSAPPENPFVGDPGGLDVVFTLGHRNQRGIAVHPETGRLYTTENGDALADEFNRLVPGGDHGWPQYEGAEPPPGDPATVDPLLTYAPPIVPTGAAFYTGANYPPQLRGELLFGTWGAAVNGLRRVRLAPDGVTVLVDAAWHAANGSVFDVIDGVDGDLLYLVGPDFARGASALRRLRYDAQPAVRLNVHGHVLGQDATITYTRAPGDVALLLVGTDLVPPLDLGAIGVLGVEVFATLALPAPTGPLGTGYLPATLPLLPGANGVDLTFQALVGTGAADKALSNVARITLRL